MSAIYVLYSMLLEDSGSLVLSEIVLMILARVEYNQS